MDNNQAGNFASGEARNSEFSSRSSLPGTQNYLGRLFRYICLRKERLFIISYTAGKNKDNWKLDIWIWILFGYCILSLGYYSVWIGRLFAKDKGWRCDSMFFLPLIFSYIIGAIPFGFLVVKAVKKVDIRTVGSGNIGATNVTRVLGKRWGILVFFLDFLKGFSPLLMVNLFLPDQEPLIYVLASLFTVAGHNWTLFLKFKGGKGVSTSLGVILGLCFKFRLLIIPVLSAISLWAILFFIFKYVSLASLSGTVCFFVITVFLSLPWEIKFFSFLILVFILIRHKKNIKKLLTKRELKFWHQYSLRV